MRRLFPALAVTLFATIAMGWAFMPPGLYRETAWSIVTAIFSASNFYFFADNDYFSDAAILKPVLHTWSLSVEEQFYFIWPVLIAVLLFRLGWRKAAFVITAIAVVSLVAAEVVANKNASLAFFMTPFRIVEFAIGALLLWLPSPRASSVKCEAMLILGLALIAYSVFAYTEAMTFPGLSTLTPCAGAALVIYAGHARISGYALRIPAVVFLGLISYSLYLTHWPLTVFYRLGRDGLEFSDQLFLLALILACSIALYYWVETPFRRRKIRPHVFAAGALAGSMAITIPATAIALGDGVVSRYPTDFAHVLDPAFVRGARGYTWERFRRLSHDFESPNDKVKVFVIGDSQAGDFVNVLAESSLEPKLDVKTFASRARCQVMFDDRYYDTQPRHSRSCVPLNAELAADKRIGAADIVVLAFKWNATVADRLPRDVRKLRELGAKRVFVVNSKTQGLSGPNFLLRHRSFEGIELYAATHRDKDAWAVNAAIADLDGVEILDLMRSICPAGNYCHVFDGEKKPIFHDDHHMSREGVKFIARRFVDAGTTRRFTASPDSD